MSRIPNFAEINSAYPSVSAVTRAQKRSQNVAETHNSDTISDDVTHDDDDLNSDLDFNENLNLNEDNLSLDIDDLDNSGVHIDNELIDDVISGQTGDDNLREMIEYIETSRLPENKARANLVVKRRQLYHLIDGVLKHLDPHQKSELRIVVPLQLRQRVLGALHDDAFAGHQGEYVTYD
ncbi:MAG: hypothetical protein GY696_35145 [Gammaproteobacteria bacterium]|nr:hypothetical protein [Gammaproteobacteria bacterium]